MAEGGGLTVQSQTVSSVDQPSTLSPRPSLLQLSTILLLAIYLMNLGYAFDGFGTSLGDFSFVSRALTGLEQTGTPGNRFRDIFLGAIPVPLPKQYVLGFDTQKKDFESFAQPSYLRGEWKQGGWWYYYLYGLLVKVPCGTFGLLLFVLVWRLFHTPQSALLCDELVLLTPCVSLLALVSSQTEFNHHLRYVFPSLGISIVFVGQCASFISYRSLQYKFLVPLLLTYSASSSLMTYPHHLAYFNDFVGGSSNGSRHLLGSSFDWGQDMLLIRETIRTHFSTSEISADWLIRSKYDPSDLGLPAQCNPKLDIPDVIVVGRSVMCGQEVRRPTLYGMTALSKRTTSRLAELQILPPFPRDISVNVGVTHVVLFAREVEDRSWQP